jgi:RNA polymerase sigma factor (sigma-70 family)
MTGSAALPPFRIPSMELTPRKQITASSETHLDVGTVARVHTCAARWPMGTTSTPSGVHGTTFARLILEIRHIVHQALSDSDLADDITQQISVDIVRRREAGDLAYFADPNLIVPITRAAVRNRAAHHYHAERARVERQVEYYEAVDAARWGLSTPETELEAAQQEEASIHLLDAVSARDRAVYFRVREEGRTYVEVAEELKLTERTVKRIMTKLNRKLRAALGRAPKRGGGR